MAVRRLPRCSGADGLGAKRPVGNADYTNTTVKGTFTVTYCPRFGPTATSWS